VKKKSLTEGVPLVDFHFIFCERLAGHSLSDSLRLFLWVLILLMVLYDRETRRETGDVDISNLLQK